ncbi:HAD family hydrolase [Terriglobus roseus]|uniref:Putative hydrolase of the HAD superfamily n=1 Tax=Terriglobus roseus TaxID=392734 RepID=A0A1H4IW78_9BACT|nr:HAD family hydrolase [Terriglobus roseus]SEB37482.1 putative hydrolase of the HAD superfamily [Terriglobus roseus]
MAISSSSSTTAPTAPLLNGQVLMIDADDTLWENNIYFERAIDRFIDLVAHPEMSPTEVREAFDRLEAKRVKTHGYGTGAFHQSLIAGYAHLTGAEVTADAHQHLAACAGSIRDAELTLLDGVFDTLPLLAAKHTLILVTKGDHEEQTAKLARSGLHQHFHHVEVLPEKHTAAYEALLDRYGCDPAVTWMIGNSPRSDANPALAAGMHAVYVPHPSTWVLEREALGEPRHGRQLLHLSSFRELLHHFA